MVTNSPYFHIKKCSNKPNCKTDTPEFKEILNDLLVKVWAAYDVVDFENFQPLTPVKTFKTTQKYGNYMLGENVDHYHFIEMSLTPHQTYEIDGLWGKK